MSDLLDSSGAPLSFPEGFVFGAATASYQVEGAVDEDGRGRSIWDTYSHSPGKVCHGDTGDIACDHYHRLEEDLDLMADLGLRAYRFSIAWPRVLPDGGTKVNEAGLDFYKRLLAGLAERGIVAVATLYHWDLPQALEDAGGWENRETAEAFGHFAEVVGAALGDGVGMWATLNEPWCSAWLGYGIGVHAPGKSDLGGALAATHHLLLGHARAVAALRSRIGGDPSVGIVLNLVPVSPATDHPEDRAAARRVDGALNRLYLDPLFQGVYPEDLVRDTAQWQPGLSVVQEGDLAAIKAPIDFLGVNYYSPRLVSAPSRWHAAVEEGIVGAPGEGDALAKAMGSASVSRLGWPVTEMGWEIDPDGLFALLTRLKADAPVPLYVTENGAAFADYLDPNSEVRDSERVDYLAGHLRAAHRAIEAGVDLRGYFAWSLMDNFEWAEGYSKRFGLIYVDYATGTRTPKASYHWYRDVIAANSVPGQA